MDTKNTAVLVHGRHLETNELERLLWLGSGGELGTLPTAVRAMLTWGVERISLISVGTGSSTDPNTGLIESQVIKQYWLDNFDKLEQVSRISQLPAWNMHKETLRDLIKSAVTDIESRNTKQETLAAMKLFKDRGITNILQVAGMNHAPRCQVNQSLVREETGIISPQNWFLIADEAPYFASSAQDVTVVEPPHKGDDELSRIDRSLLPSSIMRDFYALKTDEQRIMFLETARIQIDKLL